MDEEDQDYIPKEPFEIVISDDESEGESAAIAKAANPPNNAPNSGTPIQAAKKRTLINLYSPDQCESLISPPKQPPRQKSKLAKEVGTILSEAQRCIDNKISLRDARNQRELRRLKQEHKYLKQENNSFKQENKSLKSYNARLIKEKRLEESKPPSLEKYLEYRLETLELSALTKLEAQSDEFLKKLRIATHKKLVPNEIPAEFKCPITCEIMENPVMLTDGRTYERAAVTEWLEKKQTSPLTNEALESAQLIPNLDLKNAIERFKLQFPNYNELEDC